MKIFAIDPGNLESGYALINMPDFSLEEFGKENNEVLIDRLAGYRDKADVFAIEMVASYGMPVGKDVFETCVWIGQFVRELQGAEIHYTYRKDEKICLCFDSRAKDSNIRQALINRYAKHDFKNGKGRKDNPDVFYGVSKDAWSAIAVGVTDWERSKIDGKTDNDKSK